MLYFTRWKALGIILTALLVCLCAVPNFFPEATVKTWPAWAQRRMVLGLDLQGGSYLLREARITFTGGIGIRNDAVEARIAKDTDFQTALSKLRDLSQPLGGLMGSNGQRSLEVTDAGNGAMRLAVPQAA